MNDKTELQTEASATEGLSSTEGASLSDLLCDDDMTEFAQEVLILYFKKFGAKMTWQLEDDFCGTPPLFEMMLSMLGSWRRTPFFKALGILVDSGKVKYWLDSEQNVWYDLT